MSCIRQEGYDGMEISMPDILAFGKSLTGETISEDDIDTVVLVAEQINRHANDPGLTIIMLQPFSKFEGWDEVRRDKAFTRAAGWVRIMEALGTDMLQVTFSTGFHLLYHCFSHIFIIIGWIIRCSGNLIVYRRIGGRFSSARGYVSGERIQSSL